jgi:hypothetical protein
MDAIMATSTDTNAPVVATDSDAIALAALLEEFAGAKNVLDTIYAECHAAHGIVALKPEGISQTDYLKAQGKKIALMRANTLYPSDPEMAKAMAETDGRKPGATQVTHTALLQRAKAWEYALYMGSEPTSTVVAATFRLASASGAAKAARDAFEKAHGEGKALTMDAEEFAQAALKAAGEVPAPTGGTSGNGGAQKAVEFDVTIALAAMTWLSNNSAEIKGEDRARVLALSKAITGLYK